MSGSFRSQVRASILVSAAASAGFAVAAEPRVQFDVPHLVVAHDVTPPGFAHVYPGQKLVEVKLPISSLLTHGEEEDLTQLTYRVEGPLGNFAVADYLPKTALETQFATNVLYERQHDHEANLHINLAGAYQWLTGFTAEGKYYDKTFSHVKGELLPPLEAVAASGTTQRQRGVYFKLRGTNRTWLEGAREFAVILRVPTAWRADYVVVRCEAEGMRRGIIPSLDERMVAGRRDFVVGLHLAGDEESLALATRLVQSEVNLRRSAAAQQKETERRSRGALAKLGFTLPGEGTRTAGDWLGEMLFAPPAAAVPARVPPSAQTAAAEFVAARKAMSWR